MNSRLIAIALSVVLGLVAPMSARAAGVPTTHPGPHAAQITGSPALRNQDIFEVRFVEINGNNIVPREFLWLEPGTYRIRVTILAQHTRPPQRQVGPPREDPEHNIIELELEAGKTYHVRGRFNRGNPDQPYSVILHKVE